MHEKEYSRADTLSFLLFVSNLWLVGWFLILKELCPLFPLWPCAQEGGPGPLLILNHLNQSLCHRKI